MDRRSFCKLAAGGLLASALPPIWFPLAPSGARPARLPEGLGLCVNVMGTEAQRQAQFDLAMATFQPDVFYHWRCWPLTDAPGFNPMIVPHPWSGEPAWPYDRQTLRGYVRAMAEIGRDVTNIPWMICNEPEFGPWSPEQTVDATVAQLAVMADAGIHPSAIIGPGCNIKEPGMSYLRRWWSAANRAGLDVTMAVHLYDWREWRLADLWREFCAWFDGLNAGRLIVSEAGGGPNRTLAECIAVMPWFYGLLDDPRVLAVYASGVFPISWGADTFCGMMDFAGNVNAMGRQWLAEQARLAC